MFLQDKSVEKYRCGVVLCDICEITHTSPLNYGEFISEISSMIGKDCGYCCLICLNKMAK